MQMPKSGSQSLSHLRSESINAVVLDNDATRVELAKGSQDVPFSNADVPELACYLGSSLLLFPDFGDQKDKASICAEAK